VLRASKRVLGIPDFRLYALADRISRFLYSRNPGLKKFIELQDQQPTLRPVEIMGEVLSHRRLDLAKTLC